MPRYSKALETGPFLAPTAPPALLQAVWNRRRARDELGGRIEVTGVNSADASLLELARARLGVLGASKDRPAGRLFGAVHIRDA